MATQDRANRPQTTVDRRSALKALGGATAVAATVPLAGEAAAAPADERRTKARFKADSAEVKTFYRVNRY